MSLSELKREQQARYLQVMGIQSWVSRTQPSSVVADDTAVNVGTTEDSVVNAVDTVESAQDTPLVTELDVVTKASDVDVSQMDWPALQTAVSSCTACVLHETRTHTVFGIGDHQAEVMVIGEAPGADEDQHGEPFVGPAGQLLNNMLLAIGYKRGQVYIANILKCHPPDNRDPKPEEISECESYLKRQIALVKPKVILAVGGIAAHNLMKVEMPIGKMRGKLYRYSDTPVVVTYHPAYLLRKPSEKAKSWDDLRLALSILHTTEEGKKSEETL